MPSQETPRLLFVHAHPDDETLTTGGTIAHYAANGADVHVVTCTLGEEGEVIGERYAQLAVDAADQLGGYRISELTSALHCARGRRAEFPWRPGTLARFRHGGHPSRDTVSGSWTPTCARRSANSSPSSANCGPTSSSPTTPTAATATPTTSRPTASPPRPLPHRPPTTIRARRGRCRSSTGPSWPPARWPPAWRTWTKSPTAGPGCRSTTSHSATPTTRSTPSSTPPSTCPPRSRRCGPTPLRSPSPRTARPARCPTTSRCRS